MNINYGHHERRRLSKLKNKTELSKHIDRIHTGLGLLEGNRRQW
jgi:hypothetical protein